MKRANTPSSFIIEGIASVLLGVLTFVALPDSPTTARWLTPDEAKYLELSHIAFRGVKTNAKSQTEKKKFNWPVLKEVLKDWQLYLQALVFWSNVVPNYGLKFNIPSIIKGMGFESTTAQLLSAPPYICGAIAAVISGLYADKVQWRMPFVVGHQLALVVAFAVLFSFAAEIVNNVALCYCMVVLACIGMYPIIPANNSWTINNLAGAEKRAMGIAFMVSCNPERCREISQNMSRPFCCADHDRQLWRLRRLLRLHQRGSASLPDRLWQRAGLRDHGCSGCVHAGIPLLEPQQAQGQRYGGRGDCEVWLGEAGLDGRQESAV